MANFFRRKAAAVAVGVLALTLVGGGVAVAQPASRTSAGEAVAGADRSTGQPPLSAEDARKAQAALADGPSISVLPGTARATFAVVSSGGSLVRGYSAVSALKLATGQYQVIFNYNVSAGAFVATIGLTGSVGISPPGEIAVVGRTGAANGVFVQTWNSAGVPTDRAFHLAVLS